MSASHNVSTSSLVCLTAPSSRRNSVHSIPGTPLARSTSSHTLSTDSLVNISDKFQRKPVKKNVVSHPDTRYPSIPSASNTDRNTAQPITFYFPNGEVFRSRPSNHKKHHHRSNRPQRTQSLIPRTYSMPSIASAPLTSPPANNTSRFSISGINQTVLLTTIPENPHSPRSSSSHNIHSLSLQRNNSVTSFTSFTSVASNNTTVSSVNNTPSKALLKKQALTRDLERNIRNSLLDTPTNLPTAVEYPEEDVQHHQQQENVGMVSKFVPSSVIRHSQGTSDSDEHLAMKSSSSKSSSTKTLSTPTTSISEDGQDLEESKTFTHQSSVSITQIATNDSEDTIQSSRDTTGMMSHPGTDLSSISEEEKSFPFCESTKIHHMEEMSSRISPLKLQTQEVAPHSLQNSNKFNQRSSSSSTSSDASAGNYIRDTELESPSTSCSNASAELGAASNLQGSTTIQLTHGSISRANPSSLDTSPPTQSAFNLENIVTSLPTRLKSLSRDSSHRSSSIRLLISQRQHKKAEALAEGGFKDLTNMDITNNDVPERKRPLTSWKGDRSAVTSIINRHSKYMKFVNDAGYQESDDSSATSSPKSRLDYIIDQLELMDDSEIAELYKNGELDWLHEHGIDPESIIPRPNAQSLSRNSDDIEDKLTSVMAPSVEDIPSSKDTADFIARTGPLQRQYAPAGSGLSLAYHTADPSPQLETFEENNSKSPMREPNAFVNPAILRTPNAHAHNHESPSTLTPSTLIALEEAPGLSLKQSETPESKKTSPLRTKKLLPLQSQKGLEAITGREKVSLETEENGLPNEDIEAEAIKPLYIKYRNRSEGESNESKSASGEPSNISENLRAHESQETALAELFKADGDSKHLLNDLDNESFDNERVLSDNDLDLRPSSLVLPPSPFNGPTPPGFESLVKKNVKSVLTSNLSVPTKTHHQEVNNISDKQFILKNSSMTSIDRVQQERDLSKNLALMENSTPIRQLLNDDSLSIDGALMPPPTPPPKDSPSHKVLARKVKKQRRRQQREAERKKQKEQEALNKLENRDPSKESSKKNREESRNTSDHKKQTHSDFLKGFEKPRISKKEVSSNQSTPVATTPDKKALATVPPIPKRPDVVDIISQLEHSDNDNQKQDVSLPGVVSEGEGMNSLYLSQSSKKSTHGETVQNPKSEITDESMLSTDSFADAQAEVGLHKAQPLPSNSPPPVVKPFSVNPYNLPDSSDSRVAGINYATPYKNAAMARAKRLEVETLPDPNIDMKCDVLIPEPKQVSSPIESMNELESTKQREMVFPPARRAPPPDEPENKDNTGKPSTPLQGTSENHDDDDGSKDNNVPEVDTHKIFILNTLGKNSASASPSLRLPEIKASPVKSMVDIASTKDLIESPMPPKRRNPGLSPLLLSSDRFASKPDIEVTQPQNPQPVDYIPPKAIPAAAAAPTAAKESSPVIGTASLGISEANGHHSAAGRKPPPPISTKKAEENIHIDLAPIPQKQGFLRKKTSKSSLSNEGGEKSKKGFKNVFSKMFKKGGNKTSLFEVVEPLKKSNKSRKGQGVAEVEEEKDELENGLSAEDPTLSLPALEFETSNLMDDMFTTFDELDKRKSYLSSGPDGNTVVPVRSSLVKQPFFFRDDELSSDQIMDQQLKDDKENGVSTDGSKNNSEEDLPNEKRFITKDILGDLASSRLTGGQNAPTDSVYIDDNILFLQKEFNWKNLSFEGDSRVAQPQPESPVKQEIEVNDVSQFEEGNRYLKLAKQFKLEVNKGEALEVVVHKFEEDVTHRSIPSATKTDELKSILTKKSKLASSNPLPPKMNRGHSYNISLDYKQDPIKRKSTSTNNVQFDTKILINETYAPDQYRRYNKCVTQYTLTDPTEINKIKDELNAYKCNEMLVHNGSKKYTHFFY